MKFYTPLQMGDKTHTHISYVPCLVILLCLLSDVFTCIECPLFLRKALCNKPNCTNNIVCHFYSQPSSSKATVIHRVTYFCLCKNLKTITGSRVKSKLPEQMYDWAADHNPEMCVFFYVPVNSECIFSIYS